MNKQSLIIIGAIVAVLALCGGAAAYLTTYGLSLPFGLGSSSKSAGDSSANLAEAEETVDDTDHRPASPPINVEDLDQEPASDLDPEADPESEQELFDPFADDEPVPGPMQLLSGGELTRNYCDVLYQKRLTDSEVRALTKEQRRICRNTIFALHGRKFKSPELQRYFSQFDWYQPLYDDVSLRDLSETERHNITIIQKYE